jgi:hypothetical protein
MGIGIPRSAIPRTATHVIKIEFMKQLLIVLTVFLLALFPTRAADTRVYELRTYFPEKDKFHDLHVRFQQHTTKLFEKHGISNLGYWMPTDGKDQRLIYFVSFPSETARVAAWKAFGADPEWKKVHSESEKNGKLVAKIESQILSASAISPAIQPTESKSKRVFELRTYTTTPGNLPRLLDRFKNHTIGLFSKHGMTHFGYWQPATGQPGAENTLIYLLAHESEAAAAKSFAAFRADPVWIEAKAASEKAAGGSLTIPDGVKSLFLQATDYSPTR